MYGTVRTVVWEDGGSNSASYPMIFDKIYTVCNPHQQDCQQVTNHCFGRLIVKQNRLLNRGSYYDHG